MAMASAPSGRRMLRTEGHEHEDTLELLPASGANATEAPRLASTVGGLLLLVAAGLVLGQRYLGQGSSVAVDDGGRQTFVARGDDSSAVLELEAQITTTQCSQVSCGPFSQPSSDAGNLSCLGHANGTNCAETCCQLPVGCEAVACGSFGNFHTNAEAQGKKCWGAENCGETCCVGNCDVSVSCSSPESSDLGYICPRKHSPTQCTPKTCQSSCCHTADYCGAGIVAWADACRQCKSLDDYCREKVGLNKSTTPAEEWNAKVIELMKNNKLSPGCEDSATIRALAAPPEGGSCFVYPGWRQKAVFKLHQPGGACTSVDVLIDGLRAISGGEDKEVYVWKLKTGEVVHKFSGHTGPIKQVATFNNAAYFGSASENEAKVFRVEQWDAGTGTLEDMNTLQVKNDDGSIVQLTAIIGINAWNEAIIGQENQLAQIWKWAAGSTMQVPVDPELAWKRQIQTDAGFYKDPLFDTEHHRQKYLNDVYDWWGLPRDRRLKAAQDEVPRRMKAIVKNATENRALLTQAQQNHWKYNIRPSFDWPTRRADHITSPWTNYFTNLNWGDVPAHYHAPSNWGAVTCVIATPGAMRFATGYEDGSIRYWATYNGFLVSTFKTTGLGKVNALAAAPVGETIYSGSDDAFIRIWDAASGTLKDQLYAGGGHGGVTALADVPGGGALYSGHSDGTVIFWNIAKRQAVCNFSPAGPHKVNSIAVNPALIGQMVVASDDGNAYVFLQGHR